MGKDDLLTGPRVWGPGELKDGLDIVTKILEDVFQGAYPPSECILKALRENKNLLKEGIAGMINDLIPLKTPERFKEEKDWVKILDDSEVAAEDIDVSKLELVPATNGEEKITGYELIKRAKGISDFGCHKGQAVIDRWWMLPADFYPTESYVHVVLPGTLHFLPDGRMGISYLFVSNNWKIPEPRTGRVISSPENYFDKDWYFIRQKV